MDRCPICGWEIQFGTTCYNCVGREQDARRHGGNSISSSWRRHFQKGSVESLFDERQVDKIEPLEYKPPKVEINRNKQRLGINRFLHDIYEANFLLSDILVKRFTERQINNLKRHNLEPFLDDVVRSWLKFLERNFTWQTAEALRYFYELEGTEREATKLYKWSRSQEKRYVVDGIKMLRYASMKEKLEDIVLSKAKKRLK